ncbi:hypothetical protein AB0O28_03850 [Microbispora sp. NPDC088329]|uniref:hypothetical protein n=1 Tax=Microbispora sp. NPDC088329 TaxID=3154869 RepID=UPI00344720B8
MTRKHWAVIIVSAAGLGLVALLWWTATDSDRQLERHVQLALERYEHAFTKAGAQATLTPLPRDPYSPVLGVPAVRKATIHRDGWTVTAEFIGGSTTGPCGVDYTGRAVESEHAVLIVVEGHPHEYGRLCTAGGYSRQVTLRLNRPLGGRAVLEAVGGMPVPVTLER